MRIACISTYPPIECGIATYSQFLTDALKNLGKEVRILSPAGAKGNNTFEVFYPHKENIAAKLYYFIENLTPDIVHIQHEFGLYGDQRGIQIIEFLLRCSVSKIPVVTTLHTVYEDFERPEKIILQHILNESAAIIVHEDFQREILMKNYRISAPIITIPHGVRIISPMENAKAMLGVEGRKVILIAGYFRPSKNFERIIKIFPSVLERVPEAFLLFAARNRIYEFSAYQKELYKLIENSPAKDYIMVLDGKFPQRTFDTILSAADVMPMPYARSGQSGILAQASAFNIPVVVSDIPCFRSWIKETEGGFIARNDQEFIDGICKLLNDRALHKRIQLNIQKSNLKRNWNVIARKHVNLYDSLITSVYQDARFFYIDGKKIPQESVKESRHILH